MTGAARRGIKGHGFDRTQTAGPRLRRLRPLALLPGQMSLLRLQQPCAARPYDEAATSPRSSPKSKHRAALAPGRIVRSIFFGGGTPSLMAPADGGADHRRGRRRLGGRLPTPRSRSRPTRPASRRGASRLSRGRRQPAVDRRAGAQRRRPEGARAPAQRRRGDRARSTSRPPSFARLVRSDLRPARPDAAGLARRNSREALRARRRTSLALPAHHRAGHDVRAAVSTPAS